MRDEATEGYIRRETGISVVINAMLSLLFYALVFGRIDPVAAWGVGHWVFDFVPQGFMIALMSAFVPGMLTSRRLRAGTVLALAEKSSLPRNLAARAVVLAIVSALAGAGLIALAVWIAGAETLPAAAALSLKVAYGALLAAIVTRVSVRATLSHPG